MPHEWMGPFLTALAKSPNVTAACRAAGVSRVTAYEARKNDAEFAAAWADALDQSTDDLVGEMYRRAVEGVEEPVFYEGAVCGHKQRFSDTLAIFLAKCHRPAVYGDKLSADLSGDVTIRVEYADADIDPSEAPPGPAPGDEGGEAV